LKTVIHREDTKAQRSPRILATECTEIAERKPDFCHEFLEGARIILAGRAGPVAASI
jgi:hypothetical protein